jgi:hypothetical protein
MPDWNIAKDDYFKAKKEDKKKTDSDLPHDAVVEAKVYLIRPSMHWTMKFHQYGRSLYLSALHKPAVQLVT